MNTGSYFMSALTVIANSYVSLILGS